MHARGKAVAAPELCKPLGPGLLEVDPAVEGVIALPQDPEDVHVHAPPAVPLPPEVDPFAQLFDGIMAAIHHYWASSSHTTDSLRRFDKIHPRQAKHLDLLRNRDLDAMLPDVSIFLPIPLAGKH